MRLADVWASGLVMATVALCSWSPAQAGPPAEHASSPELVEVGDSEPPADAPEEERAEYWFGRGEELGAAGDFLGAAKAFGRSVEILRTANGLYNRAVAYEYAERFVEALQAFEDYREFVDPRSPEAEVAEEARARLRAKVGTIELRFERGHVPKQVFVDGQPREPEEFPLFVGLGEHEVVVLEASGDERRQRYTLAPGQVWTVDFTRPTEPSPRPTFKPPPAFDEIEQQRRRRIVRSLFYTSAGLTGAAAVTLGVFGGLTLRERRAFSAAQCGTQTACSEAGDPPYPADHERRFENYKLTTNVLVGVTAGLAGVTLVLGIVGFSKSNKETRAAGRKLEAGPGALRLRF